MRTEVGERKKFPLPKSNLYLQIYEIVGMCMTLERREMKKLIKIKLLRWEKFTKFDVGKGGGEGKGWRRG